MRPTPRWLVLASLALLGAGAGAASAEGPLAGRLRANDPAEVYRAIEDAAQSKDPQNAGALLETAISTKHPHIAVACGDVLREIGPAVAKDAEIQKALSKAVKAKDEVVQRNLARVLAAWADPSVDEPLSYLASGRRPAEVQAEALLLVGALGISADRPFPKCAQAILAGIKSKLPLVQMAACSAAARVKDPEAVEPLLELARRSQDKYAGLYAVWALARIGHSGSLSSFTNVLGSNPKRETMQACLKGIVDLSGPGDVEGLLSLSRSPQKDYRDAACLALLRLAQEEKMGKPPSVTGGDGRPVLPGFASDPVIERMLQIVESDPAWEVRDAASRCLQKSGESARGRVSEKAPSLIDSPERDVALTAIELCGFFRSADAYRALMKAVAFDKDPAKRMYAARALSYVNPQLAVEEWMGNIAKDRKGRETTLHQVAALGYVRHETAYQALLSIIGQPGWSEEILAEAERSLERLTARRFGRKPERWNAWYAGVKDADPFNPHITRYDRAKNRREAVAKRLYGLTDTTEQAVENGLRWLELQQHTEGLWDGNEKNFGGVIGCEPAYTALSLLAYLGAGYDGRHGKYRETVRRATEFLAATQFYDGSFPVTGGGDDSWIFAYLIGMGIWGITESWAQSEDADLRYACERGIGYLVRVQTPGAGWRYGPRYTQSDTSCTSWVLMALKAANQLGVTTPDKAYDGIDSWLSRCAFDITGEEELPEDLKTDYDKEVGAKRYFKAFTGYFTLSGSESSSLQQTSMTAVGMVCRFFMGWQRSHPFMIGSANYLMDFLPQWRKGLEKGQAIAWYFYYWYYATLGMHQMGGRFWRAWNEKIKTMLPSNQRNDPPELAGSWDPDSALLNGGRLFSTSMAVMTLETYYRFSPLMMTTEEDDARRREAEKARKAAGAGMDGGGGGAPGMGEVGMGG